MHYAGARYYMGALGRFGVVDPMSEKYPRTSPYAYVENDPVNYFDPNGKYKLSTNGRVVTRVTESFVGMTEVFKSFPVIGGAGVLMQDGRGDPTYDAGLWDYASIFVGKVADLAARPAMRYADDTGRAILNSNRRGLDVGLTMVDYNSSDFHGSRVDRYLDEALFATVQNAGLGHQANIAQPGKMKMKEKLFNPMGNDASANFLTETILGKMKGNLGKMAAREGFNLPNGAGRAAFTSRLNRLFETMNSKELAEQFGVTITETEDRIRIDFD